MPRPVLSCWLLTVASSLAGQTTAPPTAETSPSVMAGRRPGSQRWIAEFATRSFDLTKFRAAIYARRPAHEVAAIVIDLRQRVQRDQAAFVAAIDKLGGEMFEQYWLINAAAFEITAEQVAAVRALPGVARVQPSLIVAPAIRTATDSNNHDSDAVNAGGNQGLDVCAAVMDSGQDENVAASGRPHRMYFVNGDPTDPTGGGLGGSRLVVNRQIGLASPDDITGHGTAVASIVASGGWLSPRQDHGHAPRARLAGYAIANNTSGNSDLATIARAWQTIAADRATFGIVAANNSYAGSNNPLDVSQQALDSCAYNADVLVCCAAANGGASTAVSQSVANGIAVAAVSADTHAVAAYSSRGPLESDPARFYPDLAACGENTVMAARDQEAADYVASGTSMASPQVCGAALLVRNLSPTITADETKAILLASARDISANNRTAPYNSRNAYGMGLVRDDQATLLAADRHRFGRFLVSTEANTYRRRMAVTAGAPYAVAMTWHRTNFTVTTWANLDLQIYDGTTLVAQSSTLRNLYEMVRFTAPVTGTVEIRIVATSFETGSTQQWFAWAATATTTSQAPGTFSHFGTGCGGALEHTGLPTVGSRFQVDLRGALANAPALLRVGTSKTVWDSVPLPISLAAVGAPGCYVNTSGTVLLATTTSTRGDCTVHLDLPNIPSLSGSALYVQWSHADANANTLGMRFTDGGAATIGLP